MILKKEELNKINEINNFIIKYCKPHIDQYRNKMIFTDKRIQEIIEEEEDIEGIELYFPQEYEPLYIEPDDLIGLEEDIKSIEIVNNGFIKTKNSRYYIVNPNNEIDRFILDIHYDLNLETENYLLQLISESPIVGMAATHLGEFGDEWRTASQYFAIVIHYDDNPAILSEEEERKIIDSFIFEIADTTGIALNFSEIRNPTEDFYDVSRSLQEESVQSLRDLEPFNDGMSLFVSAIQINDPELKFLNFYKVLEHFSPIALNIEANELMRKKLDAPRINFENGDYIRSIFDLANSMSDKLNDIDLIIASFNKCFDFIGLFKKLPNSIQRQVKGQLKIQNLNYQTESDKINSAINTIAKIIVKTRNKVVHAKSNYKPEGNEVKLKDFKELNEFMKDASSQAIRWYARQPAHMKLDIIQ
ncbi:hypothetical protein [Psychroflexus montanilacus]|uniref:hypothetical protein n=1 Tax=Psychroflexus montanilacus TaxID=2873598 RepID=UPI001CCC142C|nr:hypothetical protein [Psychroflexus montanilacus]MBZ9652793.1 hypothetical protein [Psychroflexus montanilacus]